MKQLLEVANLTKIYRQGRSEYTALADVSFSLAEGEFLGLVGESGSGKSTLARLITGLSPADSGRISFDGYEITSLRPQELKQVYRSMQMVFQQPNASFNPRETLGRGITASLRHQGMAAAAMRSRLQELLTAVGLPPHIAERYPHEVSGGQCQRAAIARAMANYPKLLICDEVTSALDVMVQAQIVDLLARLHHVYNVSCLFISHDLALVQQLCDRIAVLNRGRLVEIGSTAEIIEQPHDSYTARLIENSLF